jgi:hypothetical protein
MLGVRRISEAGFHATRESVARRVARREHAVPPAETYCVYNETRERFVASGVEAVDASTGAAEARLRSLEPGSGTGLWILPCPEISPTSIRFPVDLVYLDDDGAILAVVASFPLAGPVTPMATAGSVLALPECTVAAGEIHVGDRLIVTEPDEMKRQIEVMRAARAAAQESPRSSQEQLPMAFAEEPVVPAIAEASGTAAEELTGAAAGERGAEVADAQPAALAEPSSEKAETAGGEMVAAAAPEPAPQIESRQWTQEADAPDWFTRLLLGVPEGPADPRKAPRESLPGLIAYYFTGGTPVGQPVRDISTKGMFVVTSERWYLGTVVRITLTDKNHPTYDRSLTVNARAVRWASDGVGVEFVLEESKRRESKEAKRMERANGMDPIEVEEFIRNYKMPPLRPDENAPGGGEKPSAFLM